MPDIKKVLVKQKEFFESGRTLDVKYRISALGKLKKALTDREQDLFDALKADFSKSYFESYTSEIALVKSGISQFERRLKSWARDKRVPRTLVTFHARGSIRHEPFGQVLIMSPWNYPVQLTLAPLIGALAAGNTAVLKPSRYVPNTVAVMKGIIEDVFDESHVALFEGGREENQALLKEKFDFIFFTGGTEVGKIVMRAAAENLTPVVLELGGKSPAIVDRTADLKKAAKSICWGKFLNAGQTCIAPDYVVAHADIKDELVETIKHTISEFYGKDPRHSPDFARIITEKHFEKVFSLIDAGKTVLGGGASAEERYIEPTVIDNVSWEDKVMGEEIFGPVLPIIPYDDTDEMLGKVKSFKKPLVMYVFSANKKMAERYLREIDSGGAVINDTVIHFANHHMPFGGRGHSGMGAYHGRHSFDTFSHRRAIVYRSRMLDNPLRYPPYKKKLGLIKKIL